MKKRIACLISFILAIFLSFACLSGCNLVTTDSDKEMKQVIANVSIDDNFSDDIYRSDLIVSYINGGYINEQYMGYTHTKNIELLVSNLINQKIIIQNAYKVLESDSTVTKDMQMDKYDPLRYLDNDKIIDAQYNTIYSINAQIKNYKEAEKTKYKDSLVGDVRTVPTDAKNKEIELTVAEKSAYIQTGIDYSDKNAVTKAADMLNSNGLLGSKYKETGKLVDSDYYKKLLKDNYDQEIIDIYEERLALEARELVTFEKLENSYSDFYNNEVSWSNADFTTKISSATAASPVIYGGYGGYGYVYNLLLGASSQQKAEIEEYKKTKNFTESAFDSFRKGILSSTTVKDLRSSWVNSGYDTKEITNGDVSKLIFTNDYSFVKDEQNSLQFFGDYTKIKDADTENKTNAQYSVTDVKTFTLDAFLNELMQYLSPTSFNGNANEYSSVGRDNIKDANKISGVDEYDAKINELLFAFSTDSGSLNKYKGYVIKPEVDGSDTEEYVKTFGEAGRILLNNGSGYVVVASDYGYHVLFYSEQLKINASYSNLSGYLDSLNIAKSSEQTWNDYYIAMLQDYDAFKETDSFLYKFADTMISSKVTSYQNDKLTELVNKYRYDENNSYVTVHKDKYSDLLKG